MTLWCSNGIQLKTIGFVHLKTAAKIISPGIGPGFINDAFAGFANNSRAEGKFIGNQTGGRVFLFLNTDDFWRDYNEMISKGVKFIRQPKEEAYGMVAVFEDLYGNLWDLLQLNEDHPISKRAA